MNFTSELRMQSVFSVFIFGTIFILIGIPIFLEWLRTFPLPTWWAYSFIFFWTLGFGMMIRWFWQSKTITVKNQKITVEYNYRRKTQVFSIKDLETAKEERISTFSTPYRLLHAKFTNGFLEISEQEYTEYEKFKKILKV